MFPFYEPENTATFSCTHVFREGKPILYVSRDEDDGAWQFLCGGSHMSKDAMIVGLKAVYDHDSSVGVLAQMPMGYYAERETPDGEWIIHRHQ